MSGFTRAEEDLAACLDMNPGGLKRMPLRFRQRMIEMFTQALQKTVTGCGRCGESLKLNGPINLGARSVSIQCPKCGALTDVA